MNHAKRMPQDWRRKFPDPEALRGRYARSLESRNFVYIQDANINGVEVRQCLGPHESLQDHDGPTRTLTLEQLARLYTIVPQ